MVSRIWRKCLFFSLFLPPLLPGYSRLDTIIQVPTTKQALTDLLDAQSFEEHGIFLLVKSVRGESSKAGLYLYSIDAKGEVQWGQQGLRLLSAHFEPITGKIIAFSSQRISLLLLVKQNHSQYHLIFQQISPHGYPYYQRDGLLLFSSRQPITDFDGTLFESHTLFYTFILDNHTISYQLIHLPQKQSLIPITPLHFSPNPFHLFRNLRLLSADRNSILISWQAFNGRYWHTFINKVNRNGEKEWGVSGLHLYPGLEANIEHFSWVNDGFGGLIATFTTQNLKGSFLHVLRVTRQGEMVYLKEIPLLFQNLSGTALWKTGTAFSAFTAGWTGKRGYLSVSQFSIYSGTRVQPERIFYESANSIVSLKLLHSPLSDIVHLIWQESNGELFTTRYHPQETFPIQLLAYRNEIPFLCDDFNGGFWLVKQKMNQIVFLHLKENGLPYFSEKHLLDPPPYFYATISHILLDSLNGNRFLVWADNRNNGEEDIYATILNAEGIPLTPSEGIPLHTGKGKMVPRGLLCYENQIFLLWSKSESPLTQSLYLSCYDTLFSPLWKEPKLICDNQSDQIAPSLTLLGSYLFILWGDSRHFETRGFDVYGQLVAFNGTILWEPNGRPFLAAPYYETDARAFPISSDTLLLAWLEDANQRFQLRYRFYTIQHGELIPSLEGYVWPCSSHQRQFQLVSFQDVLFWVWTESDEKGLHSQILSRPMYRNGYWASSTPQSISPSNGIHLSPHPYPHEKSLLITWFYQPNPNQKFYLLKGQFFRYHWSQSFWSPGGETLATGIPLFSPVIALEYRSSSLLAWFHITDSLPTLQFGRLFAPYSVAQLETKTLYQHKNLATDYLISWLNRNHYFLLCKEKVGTGTQLILFHQEL
jgi:hypothetical protein